MSRLIPVLICLLFGAPALAADFERCEKTEIGIANAAFGGASDLALRAAAAVGDTEAYDRWFGRWSGPRAEEVRQNLKAVSRALSGEDMIAVCPNHNQDGCERDTYANVFPDEPYRINLCPLFFEMPTMGSFAPGHSDLEYGTREGTLVHEMSHFNAIAGTDDICYGRTDCSALARRAPASAVRNADNYQYFTEDVTFFPVERDLPRDGGPPGGELLADTGARPTPTGGDGIAGPIHRQGSRACRLCMSAR